MIESTVILTNKGLAQIENFSNSQYKTDVSKEMIQYSRGTEQEVFLGPIQ